MALVNLFHTSFTVRWYFIVKEVRLHSERGKATVARVDGTVVAMPCRSIRITARVMTRVRPPCVGSPAPRWGLGRGGVCARAQEGSGEAVLTPEAKGSVEPELALEAKGSGEAKPAPEP